MTVQANCFQSVFSEQTSLGELIKMQIIRPYPRLLSQKLGDEIQISILAGPFK